MDNMKRFEVRPSQLAAAVARYDSIITILIITEEGPAGVASKKAADKMFLYRCIQNKLDQLTKQDLLICRLTCESFIYQMFYDIYGLNITPLIFVQNRKLGCPTGCFQIALQNECYGVLLLEHAISTVQKGNSIRTRLPKLSCDKFVNTSQKDSTRGVDEDHYQITIVDSSNDTREVGVQCTENTIRQSDVHMSQDSVLVINKINRISTNHNLHDMEPVWLIDKTAALPTEAVSRLQIMLPNREPIHVAVTNLATMLDIVRFVAFVLDVPSKSLEISSRYPHVTFLENEMEYSISKLKLIPSGVLVIKIIRPTTEEVLKNQTLTGVMLSIVAAISEPVLEAFSRFWNSVQNLFYSAAEEVEVPNDSNGAPHIPTTTRHSNVCTLVEDDDDDDDDDGDSDGGNNDQDDCSDYFDSRDRSPTYNGNSTQLL